METGKIRYRVRNFAFLGPESFFAAEAAEAARVQGKYWEYKKLLFQRQQGENRGAFTPEKLKQYAAELGLDTTVFNAAIDKGTYRSVILADAREAQSIGLRGVPSFFLNDEKLDRTPSVESLGELIEQATQGARK